LNNPPDKIEAATIVMQTAMPMVNPIVLRLFFRRFRKRSTKKTTIRGILKKRQITSYTLGHDFIPAGIHAGGLRYHGMAPQVSLLCNEKIIEAVSIPQTKAFEAGIIFAKTEGIVPAPETTHAISIAVDEALKCKETGEKKVIAFNFSGHGHLDLGAFESYLDGKIVDYEYPEEKVKEALAKLPKVG